MPPPRGKGKFSKDRKPKRNQQSLLFRRKRFCRFTVTGVTEIDYKDVDTLGDFVKVKDGYARNFLIPTRAARRATEAAIKEFEQKRTDLEKAAADKLAAAQTLGEKMNGRTVHITQKAGVDGRLFGSVTNFDIAEALNRIDFKVQKSQVRLPNGPLKTVGEHTVTVAPHSDVVAEVKVVVVGETD